MIENTASAPFSPKTSTKIFRTGWLYWLSRVSSKFWIEKRKASKTNRPNIALKPTLDMTPIGALQSACRVSSERWAEASKPVSVYCDISEPHTAMYAGLARTLQPIPSRPLPS